jgi:drug/metabolite transporter (DMT)-like permease
VVSGPNGEAFGTAAYLPLVSALLLPCYLILTRVLAPGFSGLALQFWTGASAALVLSVAAGALAMLRGEPVALLQGVTTREALLFLGLGAHSALSHYLVVLALARIEAGIAAPFQYLEIVSATLLGWLVFGDFPDPVTWAGTAIIVGSGLYVFHRSRIAG